MYRDALRVCSPFLDIPCRTCGPKLKKCAGEEQVRFDVDLLYGSFPRKLRDKFIGSVFQGFPDSSPQNSIYLNLSSPPMALIVIKGKIGVFRATFQNLSGRYNLEAEILKC